MQSESDCIDPVIVNDTTIQQAQGKKGWVLTQSALCRLLAWLDGESDSGGERYLEMRRRLVAYFDRKACLAPDELADETLNRVARRLEEEGAITDALPAQYCYIIAKFVFLESLRREEQRAVSLDEMPDSGERLRHPASRAEADEENRRAEDRLNCLERCLRQLDADNRRLITEYYQGEQRAKIENRRRLAEQFDISINALSIRACRLRDRLEACVSKCMGS